MGDAPLSASMFGRVKPSTDQLLAIQASVLEAPTLSPTAEPPRRSPPLWRYRLPRVRGQLIGCCVGESGASMLETTCRTPAGENIDLVNARPLDATPAFSALGVYWAARDYSRRQGRPIRGEGAIVTDALTAVCESGVALYQAWPSTDANYRNYSDNKPPASFRTAPRLRPAGECRRITNEKQVLQYLGAGFSLWFGGPWRGGSRTAKDGAFSWNNPAQGGHAVELLGYDLDTDRIVIGNSWDNAGWGVQPAVESGLPRGWGYCPWSQFRLDLMAEDFVSGSVEVCVICEVSWAPPVPVPVPTPEPLPVPGPSSLPVTIAVAGYNSVTVVLTPKQ